MRNEDVIRAWVRGDKATNGRGSLHTDGETLYSYDLKIGETDTDTRQEGVVYNVVIDYRPVSRGPMARRRRGVSVTTSAHVRLAARYADRVVEPDFAEARRGREAASRGAGTRGW